MRPLAHKRVSVFKDQRRARSINTGRVASSTCTPEAPPSPPQWEAALAGLGYDYDVLVSEEISRASRKGIDDFQRIDKICRERDARFISSVIDTASNEWSLVGPLLFELAARETDQLSQRIKGGMSTIAAKGGWIGGPTSFIWNMHPTGDVNNPAFSLNEDVCYWLRQAAVKIMEGESYQTIAQFFNENGFMNQSGNRWSSIALRSIFAKPAILGQRTYRGKIICGEDGEPIQFTPPVVDPDVMAQIRALHIRKGSLNKRGSGVNPQATRLLQIVECSCGGRMISFGGNKKDPRNLRRFYRCNYCTPSNGVYGDELEDFVALSAFNFINNLFSNESSNNFFLLLTLISLFMLSIIALGYYLDNRKNKDNAKKVYMLERAIKDLIEEFRALELLFTDQKKVIEDYKYTLEKIDLEIARLADSSSGESKITMAIQMANQTGLKKRLKAIDNLCQQNLSVDKRIQLAQHLFSN